MPTIGKTRATRFALLRRLRIGTGAAGIAVAMLTARHAVAEFAQPPFDEQEPARWRYRDEPERAPEPLEHEASSSTVRFHIGPAALLQPATPGLFAALDIGERAVGARLSGSWLRAESADGVAAYAGELWVDFNRGSQLHPILGAGAAWVKGTAAGEHGSAGAGVLRGALEYELPVADADARVGLNVLALVPAIGTERARPWVMGSLTVGAGF